MDFSGGVNSDAVTTIASALNPNGLKRNQLAWLYNGTVRGGGIGQRTGWQPLSKLAAAGLRWQGGYLYEPDGANTYLVCSISGHIYKALLDPPYTVTELFNTIVLPWTSYGTNNLVIDGNPVTLENPQFNPPDTEMAFFVQGENYLIIQAGDYGTTPNPTLPLFWNGSVLRRSIGITTTTPSGYKPGINEIPAATCMDYYASRIWYAQNRQYSAGDMVGGPSGTAPQHYRDSILSVTENPLVIGGDGFTVPTNAGNIRAIAHSANLNAALGEGQLFIFTRKTIYSLTVPTTRTDWINASATNQPLQTVVQLVNGSVGHRCVVPVNGDLFYQSFDPAIRSLITAVRYFQQWGNTPISQNVNRALAFNNRGLMRFSGGIQFDNRLLQLALPNLASDGINTIHPAILPLDFDIVTNLEEKKAPVWEGAWSGLNFLEPFSGDFGGLPRAFGIVLSQVDGSIETWELTNSSRTDNGDNRVQWGFESAAYTWSHLGMEFKLKQLAGGEMWVDKVFGDVDIQVYYREDADPCWRFWFETQFCVARNCEEHPDPACITYPYPGGPPYREGYKFPIVFPEPHHTCDSMGIRPTTIGYQFQVQVLIKGWLRVRGLILYALPHAKAQYEGVACPTPQVPNGMAKLPNPFA